MAPAGTPVVFVHGLWLHADSWGAWVDFFREAGYAPQAPGWPGDSSTVDETRSQPERVAGYGIEDVVEHYARIINGLEAKPIVIGHSFGGPTAQRLLGASLAAAAGDRRRPDQGSRLPVAVVAAGRIDRAAEPGQQAARRMSEVERRGYDPPTAIGGMRPLHGKICSSWDARRSSVASAP
jgi:pimeloyl-ACP methyl ester carboxylesterase